MERATCHACSCVGDKTVSGTKNWILSPECGIKCLHLKKICPIHLCLD